MDQVIVFLTLLGAVVCFTTGVIRYDLVAMLSLLTLTLTQIIPAEEAFLGFGNPAVTTVAAVLVISRSLENAGLVQIISNWVAKVGSNATLQVATLTGLVTILSAFINNIGALALLMPVAIQLARKHERSPSFLLMPMAFGSLLGGMTTLIGTPPNLIISDFRRQISGEPFRMFDFSPVGVSVAIAGVVFISLIGWRMVPRRRGQGSRKNLFKIESYLSEVELTAGSDLIGQSIQNLEPEKDEVVIAGLVREGVHIGKLSNYLPLREKDELIVRAESEALSNFVENHKLMLSGDRPSVEELGTDETGLVEAVVTRYSRAENQTARGLRLRHRFNTNLLGIARKGSAIDGRLGTTRLQMGDVLLLQMPNEDRSLTLTQLGLLPLAERQLKIGQPRRLVLALSIFAGALLFSAFGIVPSAISFSAAVMLLILFSVVSLREAYESIDWSIIVLLGAMIPVGQALETTGGANSMAGLLLSNGEHFTPVIALTLVLIATMFLSDIINNAAAAIVMAPIAISIAKGLDVSADPFLLATCIGASCAFLTPIGHQCNTIILGPGGYSFGDYWKMGLLVEIIVAVVSIPMLIYFWPFKVAAS